MTSPPVKTHLPANAKGGTAHHRVYGLDILRAAAILLVVYAHGENLISTAACRSGYSLLVLGDGVTLFFVLSGFLIGTILLGVAMQHEFTLAGILNFWLRRWFRTLPAYFLVLGVLVTVFVLEKTPLPAGLFLYGIFSQNLVTEHPAFFPEAWSLSVEEWFYFLVPLLMFVCFAPLKGVRRRKAFLALLVTGILAVTVYRIEIALTHSLSSFESWDLLLRKRVFTRLDSIGFGILGAYCAAYHLEVWQAAKRPLLVIGLLLLFYDYLENVIWQHAAYRNFLELTVSPMGTLCLLPFLTGIQTGGGIWHRFFTFISKISYSMYLLHFSVIQMLLLPAIFSHVPLGPSLVGDLEKIVVYFGLTIGLPYLLYTYYELPMMNLRDRFNFSRSRSAKP